jgi:hypothetical protein
MNIQSPRLFPLFPLFLLGGVAHPIHGAQELSRALPVLSLGGPAQQLPYAMRAGLLNPLGDRPAVDQPLGY